MNKENIYTNIRTGGGRITKIRREIIRYLSEEDCLLSKSDMLAYLKKNDIQPNRSTLYRELLALTKSGVIIKNNISGIDYYEISNDHHHHHHLVCIKCNSIQKVEMEDHLRIQEREITKQTQFNIINHSLEFYGLCRNCQT